MQTPLVPQMLQFRQSFLCCSGQSVVINQAPVPSSHSLHLWTGPSLNTHCTSSNGEFSADAQTLLSVLPLQNLYALFVNPRIRFKIYLYPIINQICDHFVLVALHRSPYWLYLDDLGELILDLVANSDEILRPMILSSLPSQIPPLFLLLDLTVALHIYIYLHKHSQTSWKTNVASVLALTCT